MLPLSMMKLWFLYAEAEVGPLSGKKWDKYEVTSLYFPEVHTLSYEKAEKLCREIGERPLTDE